MVQSGIQTGRAQARRTPGEPFTPLYQVPSLGRQYETTSNTLGSPYSGLTTKSRSNLWKKTLLVPMNRINTPSSVRRAYHTTHQHQQRKLRPYSWPSKKSSASRSTDPMMLDMSPYSVCNMAGSWCICWRGLGPWGSEHWRCDGLRNGLRRSKTQAFWRRLGKVNLSALLLSPEGNARVGDG